MVGDEIKCAVAITACSASNCIFGKGFRMCQRRFVGIVLPQVLAANLVLSQSSVQRC